MYSGTGIQIVPANSKQSIKKSTGISAPYEIPEILELRMWIRTVWRIQYNRRSTIWRADTNGHSPKQNEAQSESLGML